MPPSRVTYVLARPAAAAAGAAAPPQIGAGAPSAAAQAQAILGPQLAQQNLYAAHQNAVIQSFARSLLGQVKPIPGQVGADYNQAINQIGGLSGQAAQYLNAQNPSPVQQALTSSVGAPPEQQAQEAAQLGNVFRGGAGVLAFTGGTIPGSELAADKTAAMKQARALVPIATVKGQQDLASALWQQSQDRMKLEATRPQLVQQAQSAIDTNAYRNATLGLDRQRLGESTREFNVGERDKTTAAAATAAYRAAQLNKPTYYTNAFGQRVAVSPGGGQTVLSAGKYTDASGAVYEVTPSGKQIQVAAGRTPTPHYTTVTDSTGTYVVNEGTGERRRVGEGKAPTPHYTTVTDSTGSYVVNEDTGERRRVGEGKAATPHYTSVSDSTGTYVVNEDTGARRRVAGPPASLSKPSVSIVGDSKTGRSRVITYPNGRVTITALPGRLGKPTLDTSAPTVHGNRQWDPVKKRWVRAPGLPAATAKVKTLTPEQAQTHTQRIDDALKTMQTGVDPTGSTKDKYGHKYEVITDRAAAMAELNTEGYFSSPVMKRLAMARLNKYYPPDIVVRSKGPLGVIATSPPP